MHVDFLLEEESAKAVLNVLLPHLLPADWSFNCIAHQGKAELLARLPGRLKTYARLLPANPELRLVIMMDADMNCRGRKVELERLVMAAGLLTKTTAPAGRPFQVITRLAVAELEAWFFGDQAAIQAAYPRVRAHHFKGLPRDPDVIPETWETLHRVLQKGGYYPAKYPKIECAEQIAAHLDPARNTSASFGYFCAGLAALR